MKYKCIPPYVDDMGSISPFNVTDSLYESKEEEALWHINSMRDHDGLEHLTELPAGTKFEAR